MRFFVRRYRMLRRLLRLGMIACDVRMALLGGMRRSGFGLVRMTLGNVRMCDVGSGNGGR